MYNYILCDFLISCLTSFKSFKILLKILYLRTFALVFKKKKLLEPKRRQVLPLKKQYQEILSDFKNESQCNYYNA